LALPLGLVLLHFANSFCPPRLFFRSSGFFFALSLVLVGPGRATLLGIRLFFFGAGRRPPPPRFDSISAVSAARTCLPPPPFDSLYPPLSPKLVQVLPQRLFFFAFFFLRGSLPLPPPLFFLVSPPSPSSQRTRFGPPTFFPRSFFQLFFVRTRCSIFFQLISPASSSRGSCSGRAPTPGVLVPSSRPFLSSPSPFPTLQDRFSDPLPPRGTALS